MKQSRNIVIAVLVLGLVVGGVLIVEMVRRRGGAEEVPPGSVPIYVDGKLAASFSPADLEDLESASFVEPEEGKTQEGWLLRDILLLHLAEDDLDPDTVIVVTSTSREKSVELTWAEVNDSANMVMFDLSNRGTLKLVSQLEKLDSRDEWIQDTDKIEIKGG